MPEKPVKIGEVLQASITSFTAQSYELFESPPFGSLVRSTDGHHEVLGLVYAASTGSLDPGRQTVPLGRSAPDEASVFKQHPQLAQLLRSQFQALVVGHRSEGRLQHTLPPYPVRPHAFVYPCDTATLREACASFDFFPLVLGSGMPLADEALAALLRQASETQQDARAYLVRAGKALAGALGNDPVRLQTLLRRLRPVEVGR